MDVEEGVSTGIAEAVRESVADLGICLELADTYDLQWMPYASDRLVLVTHAAHPLAGAREVQFAETLDHRFVGLRPDSRMTALLTGAAARLGRLIDYRMHVGSFDVAAHIIAENLAIGIVPEGAIALLRERLALRVVPLTDAWARRRMVMCMRDYHSLGRPARLLVDHLQAAGRARGEPATLQR